MLKEISRILAHNKEQIFSLGSSLMRSFSRFVLICLASFFLLPDDFGIFNIFFVIYFFARTFSDGSIHLPYIKFASEGTSDCSLINSHVVVLKLIFISLVSLVLLVGANWITDFTGLQEKRLLYFVPVTLAAFGFFSFLSQYLNASLKMAELFLLECVQCFLMLVFFVYAYYSSHLDRVEMYIAAMIFSFIIAGIVGVVLYGRFISFKWNYSPKVSSQLLSYSKYSLVIAMGAMLFLKADVIMLGHFRTSSEVAIYGIALIGCEIVNVILDAIQKVCLPTASLLNAKGEGSRIKILLKKSVINAYILSIPVVIGVVFMAPFVLKYFYKGMYDQALPIIAILAVSALFKPVGYISGTILTAVGQVKVANINCWLTAILNIILNLIFIPLWGVFGAAVSTILSYIAYSFLQYFSFLKIIPPSKKIT